MLNFGLYLFLLPQKYVPTTRRKLTRIKDCMCNTCEGSKRHASTTSTFRWETGMAREWKVSHLLSADNTLIF